VLSPDDGCPSCGTTDRHHAPECNYVRTRMKTRDSGPLPRKTDRGEHCEVCEGPCRYGHCPDCGGHSEHNWGCPQTATHTI